MALDRTKIAREQSDEQAIEEHVKYRIGMIELTRQSKSSPALPPRALRISQQTKDYGVHTACASARVMSAINECQPVMAFGFIERDALLRVGKCAAKITCKCQGAPLDMMRLQDQRGIIQCLG